MIRKILACTDGSKSAETALDYAMYLTLRLKAELTGLHVVDSRALEGPLFADISGWLGAQAYGDQLGQFRTFFQERGEAIASAFEQKAKSEGVEADMLLKTGHPARIILDEETRHEVVILGRRGEHEDLLEELMGSCVERVVRHSFKPCLVTTDSFKPIQKIMIAYDGSAHASQALQEAIAWSESLQAELVILTAGESPHMDQAREYSNDAMDMVEAHGVQAIPIVAEGPAREAIADNAATHNCDLLVVGAFGHGRIREFILGSTTSHLVGHADLPVLLVR